MLILHGENTVQSRNRLFQLITEARSRGVQVVHLDAKKLELPLLEETIGSDSLFGEEKLIVIEELHSLPKSSKKDQLLAFLHPGFAHVLMWEKRDLTPTMLKKFQHSQHEQFKITNHLFKWLDAVDGQLPASRSAQLILLLRAAIESDGDFLCFTMLIRQVRMLLQAKENVFAGMAPFMIGKLKKQASTFSLDQLMRIHHQLLTLDIAEKTSSTRLNLAQELELLMIKL